MGSARRKNYRVNRSHDEAPRDCSTRDRYPRGEAPHHRSTRGRFPRDSYSRGESSRGGSTLEKLTEKGSEVLSDVLLPVIVAGLQAYSEREPSRKREVGNEFQNAKGTEYHVSRSRTPDEEHPRSPPRREKSRISAQARTGSRRDDSQHAQSSDGHRRGESRSYVYGERSSANDAPHYLPARDRTTVLTRPEARTFRDTTPERYGFVFSNPADHAQSGGYEGSVAVTPGNRQRGSRTTPLPYGSYQPLPSGGSNAVGNAPSRATTSRQNPSYAPSPRVYGRPTEDRAPIRAVSETRHGFEQPHLTPEFRPDYRSQDPKDSWRHRYFVPDCLSNGQKCKCHADLFPEEKRPRTRSISWKYDDRTGQTCLPTCQKCFDDGRFCDRLRRDEWPGWVAGFLYTQI